MPDGDEGKGVMGKIDDIAKSTVGKYYMVASALIIVLILVLLYMLIVPSEGFMPGSTMRFQAQDNALIGNRSYLGDDQKKYEYMADGAPTQGSPAWNVLNSPAFGCDKRGASNDDAWSWMAKQTESAVGGRRPQDDNDFSKIAAGRR